MVARGQAGHRLARAWDVRHRGGMRRTMRLGLVGAVLTGVALAGVVLVGGAAPAPPEAVCGPAIQAAEQARHTAPGLLAAIGLVESGRMDGRTGRRVPWPWTVTAEGVGTFYPTKAAAIGAAATLQARGVTSVDVGCMQVNLLAHPGAFRSLDEAFEPVANVLYASRFLTSLYSRFGTWRAAAAGYHSLTPALGAKYGQLIAAVWSGASLPVTALPGGAEVVSFPGGGQLRLVRDLVDGHGRVAGYLSGP